MPRTSKILQTTKDHITRLYRGGYHTQADLAQQFGLSRRTVGRILAEAGINPSYVQVTPQQKILVDICEEFGISPGTLRAALRQRFALPADAGLAVTPTMPKARRAAAGRAHA